MVDISRRCDPVPSFDALRKRLYRFLTMSSDSAENAKVFIDELSSLGEVAIFGGLLRDLSMETNNTFYSDIDIVVSVNESDLRSRMSSCNAVKNSFGGYRLNYKKWKMDIWPLHKTWAFQEGLIKGEGFKDLLATTFFNWDSILFLFDQSRFITSDCYFQKLESGVLDINLKPNPNEKGAIIRALRFIEKRDVKFSFELADYVFKGIEKYGIEELLNKEIESYNNSLLTASLLLNNYLCLKEYFNKTSGEPFIPYDPQLKLPL